MRQSAAKGRKPLTDNLRPGTSQPRMIGSSDSTRWSARAGMLGGLLWALFPLGELPAAHLMLTPKGYLAYYGFGYLCATLLLLVGLKGLHAIHRRSHGWLGSVGFFVSFVALMLVFVGGAFEMTKMVSTDTGSTMGHLPLIMSFLLLAWGSVLLGLAITEVLQNPPLYLAGLLLAIGVPLGLQAVFVAEPTRDFYFWAGLTVPYGVAWLLLGYALLSAKGTAAQPSRAM